MLRKLAKSGMKGRKRDTRLLRSVVTLSFVFITLATVLLASMSATEHAQTYSLFGSWQLMNASALADDVQTAMDDKEVDDVAVSWVIFNPGTDTTAPTGTIGTYDESFLKMGGISVSEGRMPEASGEIALEANQLGRYSNEVGIGSKIMVTMYVPVNVPVQEDDESSMDMEPYFTFLSTVTEEMKDDFRQKFLIWAEETVALGDNNSDYMIPIYIKAGYFEDYTDELSLREEYMEYNFLFHYYLQRNQLEYIDMLQTTRTEYNEPFNYGGSEMLLMTLMDISYYGKEYAANQAETYAAAVANGKPLEQKLRIMREYEITGIVETYTDRWDSGNASIPNAFVSLEDADAIDAAISSLGGKLLSDPIEDRQGVLLMQSNSLTPTEIYMRYAETYDYYEYEHDGDGGLHSYTDNSTDVIHYNYSGIDEQSGEVVSFTMIIYSPLYQDTIGYIYCTAPHLEKAVQIVADDFYAGKPVIPGILPFTHEPVPEEAYNATYGASLRVNTYAYPLAGSASDTLTILIVGIIFIVTVCAVFQIFLTQLNRRARRMALLKSVGATNSQVAALLLWETVYLLLFALPLGLVSGMAISYGAVAIMNVSGGTDTLLFTIDWQSLIIGLTTGVVAVLLGMLVPLIRAMRTPLVGRMNTAKPKRKKHNVAKRTKEPTFARVSLRNIKANRVRTVGTLALCCFILAIELICVFLAFNAFADYNTTVLLHNKPDYLIEAPYGITVRALPEYEEAVSAPEGIEYAEAYKVARYIYLNFEGMKNSPILGRLDASFFELPVAGTYRGNTAESESYVTTAYGVDVDSPLMETIIANITEGKVDFEKLREGTGIILLVPMYREGTGSSSEGADASEYALEARASAYLRNTNKADVSFERSKAAYYLSDNTVAVGNTITLAGLTQNLSGDVITTSLESIDVSVEAIIRYFPEEGVWPFAEDTMPYTVISGNKLITSLYRSASSRMNAKETEAHLWMRELYYPHCWGETHFYAYASEDSTRINGYLPLLTYARDNGLTVQNYYDSNQALYNTALNNAMLVVLLGVAITMIAIVMLGNTLASSVIQERRRTGVLQALGVTRGKFRLQQFLLGLLNALIALIVANHIIVLVLLITSLVNNAGLGFTLAEHIAHITNTTLWRYPWAVHGICCGMFVLLVVYLHLSPLKATINRSPIENIRS